MDADRQMVPPCILRQRSKQAGPHGIGCMGRNADRQVRACTFGLETGDFLLQLLNNLGHRPAFLYPEHLLVDDTAQSERFCPEERRAAVRTVANGGYAASDRLRRSPGR